jgi:hypothetical protein
MLFHRGCGYVVKQDEKVDIGVWKQLAASESAYREEGEAGGEFRLQAR